jgi:diguanylate cyclase (GGDEF)-like protein
MASNDFLYKHVFQCVPFGLFILDKNKKVVAWNTWMEIKTDIFADHAIGKGIELLFPKANFNRLFWALEQIQMMSAPQVLSQALNQYLIPIPLKSSPYDELSFMQQHVEVFPIPQEDSAEFLSLVVIEDVTHIVHQKNIMMEMGANLESASYHDLLTGLYNRRYLFESFAKHVNQARRDHYPITYVMIDLDLFKKINDVYGHSGGDILLNTFVDLVNNNVRSTDIFIRYGGEEFLLVMPHTTAREGCEITNFLRVLWSQKVHTSFGGEKLTFSAGLSEWDPEDPQSLLDLIAIADKALYIAKEHGRNRIVYNDEVVFGG